MIGWQNVAALWALPLLAIPIVVHLLRVHRADRVLFPSLRFVQPSRTAAVRLRMPSDLLLLALRMTIVAMAIAALARPVVVTSARLRNWNARTARAVVVDTSASMQGGDGMPLVAQARDAAGVEAKTATYTRTFEARHLEAAIGRAAAWLATTPPARREIVVLSDFQRGTIGQDTVGLVPASIGLRLVPIGNPVTHQNVSGGDTLGAPGVPSRQSTMELTPDSTRVAFVSQGSPASAGADASVGIRFVSASPADQTALLRALAHAGTPAGSADEPIAFVFDIDKNSAALEGLRPIRESWMLRTILRFQSGVRPWSDPGTAIGVRPGSDPSELVIGVPAPASSFTAASIVRDVMTARHAIDQYAEKEIARTADKTLAAWNRQPAAVDREAWRTAPSTDARWCWLIALILLGLEQWLRARQPGRRSQHEVTRVAA